jgi:hypothetical protein
MSLEEHMRHMLLLLPLVAVGCAQNYDAYGRPYGGYSGGYDTRYPASSYYSQDTGRYPAYASRYGYTEGYYGQPYYGGENCGTPDEPKGCPPLPRAPLAYYPGDRW